MIMLATSSMAGAERCGPLVPWSARIASPILATRGMGGLDTLGCCLLVDSKRFSNEEQGPALHFFVHASKILADHAERDELHAGKEHYGNDQRREAGDIRAEDQRLDQNEHGIAKRQE